MSGSIDSEKLDAAGVLVTDEMVDAALNAQQGSWTTRQLLSTDDDEHRDIMRRALTAALAARQPVGQEPVRYVRWHPEHGYRWDDTSSDFHGDYSRTGWTSKALYAAPPAAQAVDLGQFRGAVEAYKAAVNEDCYFDPSDYDDNIAYADRLLALIDQQAGKAGGA